MYLPKLFEETRIDVLQDLIRAHPLGTLITLQTDGLEANHLPFEIDVNPAPLGTLRCHVARTNAVWNTFSKQTDSLVIFQGPQAYISPSWYATKKDTGTVVPTWNYAVVHAYGRLQAIEDRDWLRGLVGRLTQTHEAGQREPWNVSDAPAPYFATMLENIVGLELTITRFVGKWKTSQNRPHSDRASVITNLVADGRESSISMAQLVQKVVD